jgi:FkbM family methyltransferase
MLKDFARHILRTAAARAPGGVQLSVLEGIRTSRPDLIAEQALSVKDPWTLVTQIAQRVGIITLGVRGQDGHVIGSARDVIALQYYARDGRWAARTADLLCGFFGEHGGGTYIDIGANIGFTTIPVAQQATVTCVAIEADPDNARYLRANVAANCPHPNVTVHHVALFSSRGHVTLEVSPDNPGDNRVRTGGGEGVLGEAQWRTVTVEAAPLDDVVTAPAKPLALKIDVQGAEPHVFEGGRRTLAQADLLIVEWAPYFMARVGGDPAAVTSRLGQFGRLQIADREDGAIGPLLAPAEGIARLQQMYERDRHDPQRFVDVIARR